MTKFSVGIVAGMKERNYPTWVPTHPEICLRSPAVLGEVLTSHRVALPHPETLRILTSQAPLQFWSEGSIWSVLPPPSATLLHTFLKE